MILFRGGKTFFNNYSQLVYLTIHVVYNVLNRKGDKRMRNYITDFGGKILGYTEDYPDKIMIFSFGGKILGIYDKRTDTTREFGGKIVARGNHLSMLLDREKK